MFTIVWTIFISQSYFLVNVCFTLRFRYDECEPGIKARFCHLKLIKANFLHPWSTNKTLENLTSLSKFYVSLLQITIIVCIFAVMHLFALGVYFWKKRRDRLRHQREGQEDQPAESSQEHNPIYLLCVRIFNIIGSAVAWVSWQVTFASALSFKVFKQICFAVQWVTSMLLGPEYE